MAAGAVELKLGDAEQADIYVFRYRMLHYSATAASPLCASAPMIQPAPSLPRVHTWGGPEAGVVQLVPEDLDLQSHPQSHDRSLVVQVDQSPLACMFAHDLPHRYFPI